MPINPDDRGKKVSLQTFKRIQKDCIADRLKQEAAGVLKKEDQREPFRAYATWRRSAVAHRLNYNNDAKAKLILELHRDPQNTLNIGTMCKLFKSP